MAATVTRSAFVLLEATPPGHGSGKPGSQFQTSPGRSGGHKNGTRYGLVV